MANLLETSEIKREPVHNLISDQYTRDVIPRNQSFILECPDCKKKFWRMILLLQHREVHKRNRKLIHSENKKKQRKRRPSDGPSNNKEVECTEYEKQASSEYETQPREEIKNEFECSEYTLTPFTHNGVHIKKDFVEEDESKHNDKSEYKKRKRHQVKDNALRPHKCEICNRTFAWKCRLTEHLRIHTGEKPFECKNCFSRYRTKTLLIKHSARVHTNDKPFQCKICSSSFKIKRALIKHSITRHPENNSYKGQTFECDVCQKKFLQKSDVFIHKRVHTREKPFNCAVCQKGYWYKLDLVQHLKSHTGDKQDFMDDSEYPSFKCEICSKTFTRKEALKSHERVHTDDKPFQCKICSLKFKTKTGLVGHSYRQHPEDHPYKGKTFECDVCQKKFPYKRDFVQHKRIHTGKKPFNCAVCQKGYWNKVDLVQHLKRHPGTKNDFIDDSQYSSFKCEICSKMFTGKKNLNRHKIVHTNDMPFQCKICPSRFKTKPGLVQHSYRQHPEDYPYKGETFECDACQKQFPLKSMLLNHKRIHTTEKPFHCAVCQKRYWYKLDLMQHLKRHTGDKKDFTDNSEYSLFKCEICSKTFTRKTGLKSHQRVHTDDKPFQCKICSLKFKSKPGLVEHSYRQHPEDHLHKGKTFECEICSKTFMRTKDLKSHQSVHTNDKPFQCKICSLKFKSKPGLVQHSYRQHPEDHPYKGKAFECDACQKKFPLKSMLLNHKEIHTGEKPFNCAVCQKGYWNKLNLVKHLKSHTAIKCEICRETFMQKGKLTEHLRSHTDDRQFQCKICALRFKTKLVLVKHSITQHPENTPYKSKEILECDACQKKFLYKSDFLNHKRIHTKEKPFNCPVCQEGYWKKLALVKHLKRHTGNEKDFIDDSEYPSFECEICSKTYKRRGDLNRHETVHTNDRLFQCKICFLTFETKPLLVKHSYKQHPENECKIDHPCDVCQKKFLSKSDIVYYRDKHTGDKHLESLSGNEREKDENLVLERCSEENASLQCEAQTKEEMKIEVNEEFECSEYTLQPFTYHGVQIENNGVEKYESKHKCTDVHEESKHQVVDQVRENVTDSESRDHCYVEEKLEKHKFNEPYPEVVDIKEDTYSDNYTSGAAWSP